MGSFKAAWGLTPALGVSDREGGWIKEVVVVTHQFRNSGGVGIMLAGFEPLSFRFTAATFCRLCRRYMTLTRYAEF
jgi:hypothetical protein